MTNRRDLTLDSAVAVLEERIANALQQTHERFDAVKIELSEIGHTTKALETRERERNDRIAKGEIADVANEQRWAEHLAWAEKVDKDVASRLRFRPRVETMSGAPGGGGGSGGTAHAQRRRGGGRG